MKIRQDLTFCGIMNYTENQKMCKQTLPDDDLIVGLFSMHFSTVIASNELFSIIRLFLILSNRLDVKEQFKHDFGLKIGDYFRNAPIQHIVLVSYIYYQGKTKTASISCIYSAQNQSV